MLQYDNQAWNFFALAWISLYLMPCKCRFAFIESSPVSYVFLLSSVCPLSVYTVKALASRNETDKRTPRNKRRKKSTFFSSFGKIEYFRVPMKVNSVCILTIKPYSHPYSPLHLYYTLLLLFPPILHVDGPINNDDEFHWRSMELTLRILFLIHDEHTCQTHTYTCTAH